jgi:putative FmdB family regulatory protein
MPIFSFHCAKCGYEFEELLKTDDPYPACPACESQRVSKQIAVSNFVLKGTGWYKTDFKNKNNP